MDRRLYAIAGVGLFISGSAHAVDCETLPIIVNGMQLRSECERSKQIAEENRLRVKLACRQLKMAHDNLEGVGGTTDAEDRAMMERDLKNCAQDFPRLGIVSSVPSFVPATTPATAYTRGLAALKEDDFDAAIREFTAAITDDPSDAFPYIRRAAAYEKKGDAASAIADYRKVLKLVDAESGAEYAAKIRKLGKTKK